ncbi:MAG: ADOP family duplicated permease [Bryobacteraceae bacterium]
MRDRVKATLRSIIGMRRLDAEMQDEIQFHIESYACELVRQGVPPEEAAMRARRAFGNIGRVEEECREAKGAALLDELWRNITYALRQFRRSPGYAAVVILTLALCIGANTAIFSVIDAALLRSLPYPEQERLGEVVRVLMRGGAVADSGPSHDGRAWEALQKARSFQSAAVGSAGGVNLALGDRAVHVQQRRVSRGYFRVLGVPLALGREFDDTEDREGGPSVVILSHGLWNRLFQGDPQILGRSIQLRGEPYVVIGIAAEGFRAGSRVDLWTPLKPSTKGEGAGTNYGIFARLAPGASWEQARAEAQTLGASAFEGRTFPPGVTARLDLQHYDRAGQNALRERLLLLGAAVGLVLLIGCVNIASVMLARGSARSREMGTRVALGGGPASLSRQLISESLLLALLGGVAGVALGYFGIEALQAAAERFGIWQEVRLDARVLSITALLSISAGLLFGLAPALQAARFDVRRTLIQAGSHCVAGGQRQWPRRALVVAEVALSLVLLVGAGLLIRTVLYLQNLSPGFDPTNVVTASASLQDARYNDSSNVNRLFRETLDAIRAIPGVEAAAVGLHVPYQRWLNTGVRIRSGSDHGAMVGTSVNYVTPGYFETLRIPLRSGRFFDDRDSAASMPAAIINETFARKLLNGANPLSSFVIQGESQFQVVGVVNDLQQRPGLTRSGPLMPEPAMYIPAAQISSSSFQIAHTWNSPAWVVRATGQRQEIIRRIESAIASYDPLLPVASIRSMSDERNIALYSERANAWLLGSLAGLALTLALVGVYGIMSHSVTQRTREFGIRMALGGSVPRVIGNAVTPGIFLALTGVLIGVALALGAVRLLKGLLYGVQPIDATTFAIASLALIGVSGLASLVPAIGLTRLAPASVLRQD